MSTERDVCGATFPGHDEHGPPHVCLACLRRDVRTRVHHRGYNGHRCDSCATDYVTMPYPPPEVS